MEEAGLHAYFMPLLDFSIRCPKQNARSFFTQAFDYFLHSFTGGMGKFDSRELIELDFRKWIKLDHFFPKS